MSSKAVMKFADLAGDFQDANHKNWIEISSLEFSTSRNVLQESGNPKRNIGSATISKILITKHVDNSTPSLFLESISGTGKDCVIHLMKGGENLNTYLEYKLENAVISKYSANDLCGGGETTEHIEISFTSIRKIYTPYDTSGKKGIPMASGYDIIAGKRI